jgi:hypothetical protein
MLIAVFEKTPVRYREYSLYKYSFRRFVLKNRLISKGILAVMLVFGMVFAGCKQPASEEDKQVIIKINGVSGFDAAMVWVFAELPSGQSEPVNAAVGYNTVEDNALQALLVVPKDNKIETKTLWQGGGNYYVAIVKVEAGKLTNTAWGYSKGSQFAKVSFDVSPVILKFSDFAVNS